MYRIMIVEDDEGIARGVSQLLTAWGMEAVVVQNFQNVAGEFAQTNPQLVLMDIGLPFMNGYHWCSEKSAGCPRCPSSSCPLPRTI